MQELTKEQSLAFSEANAYENMSYREKAVFQMNQRLLCMPFSVFHEAVEKTIGRPVFTHEFAMNYEGIKAEVMEGKTHPSFEEIMSLIPKDKQIVIVTT